MIRQQHIQTPENVVYYSYHQFADLPHVSNIVSTRLGGVSREHLSSLNLSFSPMVGDCKEHVIVNRERFYNILQLHPKQVAQAELVHDKHVAIVSEKTPRGTSEKLSATDGLITNVPGIALFIPVADCSAISFYDPRAHVIGMIHSGWRGTVAGIIPETIKKMSELGSDPADVLVGISPVLERCCYEVQTDLVDAVTQAFPQEAASFFSQHIDDIHYQFDFLALLHWQLTLTGILHDHIETSGMCTACNIHEFYSHRGERGKTGRFAGLIYMHP